MSMITDPDYILQAIRLSTLRNASDSLTPRIISLDPAFSLNPYINASGLSDLDRWPEIQRALDSPPLESSFPPELRPRRRAYSDKDKTVEGQDGGAKLKYTQTIMGGKSGGLGMRVTGRERKEARANSSSAAASRSISPLTERTPMNKRPIADGFFSPAGRPRADSAPVPHLLEPPHMGTSIITTGRGMGAVGMDGTAGILEQALSVSGTEGDIEEEEEPEGGLVEDGTGIDDGVITGQSAGPLTAMVDEGSDVDEDELEEEGDLDEVDPQSLVEQVQPSARSSLYHEEPLNFAPVVVRPRQSVAGPSALTAALHKHVPHLVTSTSMEEDTPSNPFASLYASSAALSNVPSFSLELYFPHSDTPAKALEVKVRKDATVEEVTGYGLYRYWEDQRAPSLSEQQSEERWSTVGWGLRIVEDDGEVDEDFPPLDRESQISKFSYGQFAIVEASASQVKQNAAKAPHIQRRPSRIIAQPRRTKPSIQGRPSFNAPPPPVQPSAELSGTSLSSNEYLSTAVLGASALKGSVGLSSALSKPVLLRVKVTASADVHFTTTISAPSDMYIADLTDVLCRKKRLAAPSSDWVLCLADLTLALPLDRTVASLEGRTDLALVRRQWAVEHGLRIGDRRGGDPSASIFKRISEPAPLAKFGAGLTEIAQTYKKYHVQRKIAIGRHERVLAIDGDYIHIMPSESRTFFDSMKTTSFHITLVAACKLTGKSGGFKINVWRDGHQKRYEFEADSGRQAAEIITSIRALMKGYQAERNSVGPPPRPAPTKR